MNEIELKKIWWHSRRGMLELDLLLLPFVSEKLGELDDKQTVIYQRLLEQEDQDLFSWLIEKELAPDPELREMVQLILTNNEANKTAEKVS